MQTAVVSVSVSFRQHCVIGAGAENVLAYQLLRLRVIAGILFMALFIIVVMQCFESLRSYLLRWRKQ